MSTALRNLPEVPTSILAVDIINDLDDVYTLLSSHCVTAIAADPNFTEPDGTVYFVLNPIDSFYYMGSRNLALKVNGRWYKAEVRKHDTFHKIDTEVEIELDSLLNPVLFPSPYSSSVGNTGKFTQTTVVANALQTVMTATNEFVGTFTVINPQTTSVSVTMPLNTSNTIVVPPTSTRRIYNNGTILTLI